MGNKKISYRGLVVGFDKRTNTGIIKDIRNREWFFYADEVAPTLFSTVTFEKDTDYKDTNVACNVRQTFSRQTA